MTLPSTTGDHVVRGTSGENRSHENYKTVRLIKHCSMNLHLPMIPTSVTRNTVLATIVRDSLSFGDKHEFENTCYSPARLLGMGQSCRICVFVLPQCKNSSVSASVKQGPVAAAALRNDNLFLILDEIKLYRVSAKVMKNNEYIWRLTLLHYTLCTTGKLLC